MWFEIFAGWVVLLLVGMAVLVHLGRSLPAFGFLMMVLTYLLGSVAMAHWMEVSLVWPILAGLSICAGALCLLAVLGGARGAAGKA